MKKDLLNELSKEMEDVLNEGRELLEDAQLQERFEEFKTESELLIRKHPIKSVLVSAAAGFILAKLLRS